MALTKSPSGTPHLALLFFLPLLLPCANANLGVCISKATAHLMNPLRLCHLLKAHNINMVRLLSKNPNLLSAFKGSGIKLMVGVANSEIMHLADGGVEAAANWLKKDILAHVSGDEVKFIAIGDEVLKRAVGDNSHALLALQNMYKALQQLGLDSKIKVSSPCSSKILGVSMPPSAGKFAPASLSMVEPLLKHLNATGAPFLVNIDPIESFMLNTLNKALDFYIFQANATPVVDNGRSYTNIVDAIIDALVAAMEKAGYPGIPVTVTSVGWPMSGKNGAANVANALAFVQGVIGRALNGTGTPMRPKENTDVFLSDVFSEGRGKKVWKNMGIFNLNGTLAVNMSFNIAGTVGAGGVGLLASQVSSGQAPTAAPSGSSSPSPAPLPL